MTEHIPDEFGHQHYVPILLTRQGERLALRESPESTKDELTPLFVVHPLDRDLDTGDPKRSVEEHLSKLAAQLSTDWGPRPAFVDLQHLDPMDAGAHTTYGLMDFLEESSDQGLSLTPVLTSHCDHFLRKQVLAAAAETGGLCLRLLPDEWADLGTPTGNGLLLTYLSESDLPPERIHLVLDCAELGPQEALTAAALRGALLQLPHANEWRSLTVAGTGMPSGTAEVGADNTVELSRVEWRVWRLLVDGATAYRLPTFGDYAVQHPDPISDFDPRYMDSSAQLRYTISTSWLVARGRGVKKQGHGQVRRLASDIIAHPEFAGEDFSWGDEWLVACARGSCSAGNQGVWRKVTTNHHLSFVVSQIANLLGS